MGRPHPSPEPATDPAPPPGPVTVDSSRYPTDTGPRPALLATPAEPRAALLFVHENKGLTPYMRGVVEALSADGFIVLAPDLLARLPAAVDPETVTTRLIPMERHVADIRSALDLLQGRAGDLPLGMIGFCFGAEAAMEAARGRSELDVLVAWYGVPPAEAADLPDPILIILAADDERVNRPTGDFLPRLEAARKDYVAQSFPGTRHAFHDWTRPERHAPRAAAAAWEECRRFLTAHLR